MRVTPPAPSSFSWSRDGACGPGPTLGALTGATVERVNAGGGVAAMAVLRPLTNDPHHPPLAAPRVVCRAVSSQPGPPGRARGSGTP